MLVSALSSDVCLMDKPIIQTQHFNIPIKHNEIGHNINRLGLANNFYIFLFYFLTKKLQLSVTCSVC